MGKYASNMLYEIPQDLFCGVFFFFFFLIYCTITSIWGKTNSEVLVSSFNQNDKSKPGPSWFGSVNGALACALKGPNFGPESRAHAPFAGSIPSVRLVGGSRSMILFHN